MPVTNSLKLDVVVYREADGWLAHCLQLDLAEAGATPEAAEEALAGVIRAHVEWVLADDDLGHLFSPAPPEVWRKLWNAEPAGVREIPIAAPPDRRPAPASVTVTRATFRAAA